MGRVKGFMPQLAALTLLASTATVVSPEAVQARSCHAPPNTTILNHKPRVTVLPYGARLRVWNTGKLANGRGFTLSEIYVPVTSRLKLHVWAAPHLTSARRPTAVLKAHPHGFGIMNAGVFDPGRGSLPQGIQIRGGKVEKAEKTPHNAIVIGKTGRIGQANINVTGWVAAGSKSMPVTGLNWQSVAGNGVNVYASPSWGSGHRPAGSVDVVVSSGVVRAIRHSGLGQPPAGGQQILTGTGNAAAFLNGLHVNQKITVKYGFHTAFHYSEPTFPVVDGVDHDMPFWLEGKKWPVPCNPRGETLWSRTAFGMKRDGSFFLVVVSGPNGGRSPGGTSASNLEYYLHRLGAYDADGLDNDTSATLAMRKHAGGAVTRVDKPNSAYQRAVVNYLGIS